MEKYVCHSDDYASKVQRGKSIIVENEIAIDENGDVLDVDLEYLRTCPDFELVDGERGTLEAVKAETRFVVSPKLGKTV